MRLWEVMTPGKEAGEGVRSLLLSRVALFAAALLFALAAILPDPWPLASSGSLGDPSAQAVFLDASGDDDEAAFPVACIPAAHTGPRFCTIKAFVLEGTVGSLVVRHELEFTHARGPPAA